MITRLALAGCALAVISLLGVRAEARRDPLTPAEIDQIRDSAQEPEQRLKFYVKFTRARIDGIAQARSDPKVTDKGAAVHNALQDFLDLYDELDENVETFADRKYDIRKALKLVLEADAEFQSKLHALKDSATANPAETKQYEFLLANAVEAVDGGAKDHRDLLTEQEDLAKHKRLIKLDQQQQGPTRTH